MYDFQAAYVSSHTSSDTLVLFRQRSGRLGEREFGLGHQPVGESDEKTLGKS